MVHGENVDEILADHVEDAVGKAMKPCAAHAVVVEPVGLGVALDPHQAGLGGAQNDSPRPTARDSYQA